MLAVTKGKETMSLLLISSPMPADVSARAEKEFGARLAPGRDMNLDDVVEQLRNDAAPALLTTTRLRLDALAVGRLPETLRVVATCSVGYDHIDVVAAAARGLIVTNTPDVLTNATADLTLLHLLAASRRANECLAVMANGWGRRLGLTEMLGIQLTGKVLGIIGMGRIGQAVAHRAKAFGMRIAYHNPRPLSAELEQGARFFSQLDDLLEASDAISLHVPGTADGAPLLDARRLGLLRDGAIVINTARGSFIDQDALIGALESGRIFAAGLDVFPAEPSVDPRLLQLPNVFLTPHMGSATLETRSAMGHRALDNVRAVLAGRLPKDAVTVLSEPS